MAKKVKVRKAIIFNPHIMPSPLKNLLLFNPLGNSLKKNIFIDLKLQKNSI